MTVNAGYGADIGPAMEKTVQPGGGHTAAVDYNLHHNVAGLWYQGLGTFYTKMWPDPDTAPELVSTNINTVEQFAFGSGAGAHNFEIPWFMHKSADRIRVTLNVAIEMSLDLDVAITLKTATLITAVATTTAEKVLVARAGPVPTSLWTTRESPIVSDTNVGRWALGAVQAEIVPTLPADRRVALQVFGEYSTPVNPTNLSTSRTIKLYSIRCQDVMKTVSDF